VILLLGGTSETAQIALRLAEAGFDVLISTATDEPLTIMPHARVRRRSGRLAKEELIALIKQESVSQLLDAAHPYAVTLHQNAQDAAEAAQIPYVAYVRPETEIDTGLNVHHVADHNEAAQYVLTRGGNVLLTTGSNTLAPYAALGASLFVRVLPREDSLEKCRHAGIPKSNIIAERGPFTIEQNRAHIQFSGAKTLVTKDGGEAAAVEEKIAAAKLEGCQVVILERPKRELGTAFNSIEQLIQHFVQKE